MFDIMELVVPFAAKEFTDLTSKLYQEVMVSFFCFFNVFSSVIYIFFSPVAVAFLFILFFFQLE